MILIFFLLFCHQLQGESQSNPDQLAYVALKGVDLKSQNTASLLTVKNKIVERSVEDAWKLIKSNTDQNTRISPI